MKIKRAIPVHSYHREAYITALKMRETDRLTGAEIARRLGLNRRTVCLWLQINRNDDVVYVQAHHTVEYRKALRLWRRGIFSKYAIARKLGIYPRTVSYWLKKEQDHATLSK